MGPAEIAALSALMAGHGIARLELEGPAFTLALARGGAAPAALDATEAEPDLVPILAPALGRFLRTHPLHDRPLADDGAALVAGQPLALLAVGALLTPVPAPADGMIVASVAEEGALVGYGDRLFDFLPND